MKDGEVIDPISDGNIIILDDGTLILESVRERDAGEYVCVASNPAGRRDSLTAVLELFRKSLSVFFVACVSVSVCVQTCLPLQVQVYFYEN